MSVPDYCPNCGCVLGVVGEKVVAFTRETLDHVLYDTEDIYGRTRFFSDPFRFAQGDPKSIARCPEFSATLDEVLAHECDCNLPTGSMLPTGYAKTVAAVFLRWKPRRLAISPPDSVKLRIVKGMDFVLLDDESFPVNALVTLPAPVRINSLECINAVAEPPARAE